MSFEIPYNTQSRQYQHEISHHLRREQIYDPDYGLSRDPHWYAKLDKDAIIGFLCRFRRQLVAGAEWAVEGRTEDPKDKQVAKIMEILLGEIDYFQEARYLLADSFLKGSTWARIGGRKKRVLIPKLGPLDFWVVTQLRDSGKRRFERRKDLKTAHKPLREHRWDWVFSGDNQTRLANWEKVNPEHWIHHVYENRESGLGWGVGLSGPLYFLHLVKAESFTKNFQYIDRWANGMITAQVESLANGNIDETSLTRMREWVTALEKMRSEHILVHGQKDGIKVYDAPQGGDNAAAALRDYCDNAASRLILGSVLPTGGNADAGSLARAAVESDSTKSLVTFDRNKLSESLGQLIKLLWKANAPIFAHLGLRDANLPRFKINFQQNYDAAERATTAATLVDKGFGDMMSKKQVVELSGFRVADDGEETVTPKMEQGAPGEMDSDGVGDGVDGDPMGEANPALNTAMGEAEQQGQAMPSALPGEQEPGEGMPQAGIPQEAEGAPQAPAFNKEAVSSVLEITKAVTGGELPSETAIMMLTAMFGFSPEVANAMVEPAALMADTKRVEDEEKKEERMAELRAANGRPVDAVDAVEEKGLEVGK